MIKQKNRKGLMKKLCTGALVATAVVGLGVVEKQTRTYDQFNEKYQGHFSDEGAVFFVFDKKSPQTRGDRKPEYFITGNPDLTKELEIGKKYDVEIMKNGFPIGLFNKDKITSINLSK